MKRFAAQSGLEVLIPSDALRGIRTPEVRGQMTARQALDALLVGTGLTVLQDVRTSAFAIMRKNEAGSKPGQPAEQMPIPPRPSEQVLAGGQKKQKIAKAGSRREKIVMANPLLAGGVGIDFVDEMIELSPFVIRASQGTGYRATATLAGTRLNTPIKDIGAPISVYTRDLLEDLGATNANDLLIYATSMEIAGPEGNFSGTTSDINAEQVTGDGSRINPQASSRSRGLQAPNFTRGFFITEIPADSYNVENVTVSRSPNAILFGIGSPAGVVESTLLRPDLARNKNKVSVRVGNNSSLRNTVDFNRVLIKDRMAVRLAAVADDERYNQRPAFQRNERIYGALTFEPFESTALRVDFETGNQRSNRPITVLPFNSISSFWEAAGRPGYDWTYYDDPGRNPDAANQVARTVIEGPLIGQNQFFDQVAVFYGNPSARTPDFALRARLRTTTGNETDAVKAQMFNAQVNRDSADDLIRFLVTRNVFELPSGFWTNDNVLPGQLPGVVPAGIKQQGFTDFSAFDFKNQILDETSRQSDSFHAFNLAFEQRTWEDRLGLEFAYDTQRTDRHSKDSFFSSANSAHVRIDPNVTLPTGQPNPNLGRPFVVFGQSQWVNNFSKREAMRATAFLKYDFSELGLSLGRWLGRHTLTGLYERNTADTLSYSVRLASDGAAARSITSDISSFNRRPLVVVYIGPSIIGNSNPLRLEPIRIPELNAGLLPVPASYFVRAGNETDPGTFVDSPASLVELTDRGSIQRDVIKSQAFLLQSYWLQEHLITLVGWRRDQDFFVRKDIGFVPNPADPNDPGKVHYSFDDFTLARTPPPNIAGETLTYSAVLRWPQQLVRLPAGADFSVFYSQSSNFTPSGGRVNAFNEPLASPRGATKEYGFNLSLFNDRFSLRVNWFETGVLGASSVPAVYSTATNNAVLQRADRWGEEGNFNPQLVAMRNADIELLFSPLPTNFRALYGQQINGTAPNLAAAGRIGLAGSTDTTDFLAKGEEFEFVYNPTSHWRIMANVARQETVASNSLTFLKRFIGLMMPVWNQLRDRPFGNYPVGWQPGDSLGGAQTLGEWIDANVLVPFATAVATEGSASAEQRKWRANLITNYTFGRDSIFGDRLKGWSLGGAVRWQDKLGIGYPTTRNADQSVTLDLAHPYYAPSETNIDAWIGYERLICNDRIGWKVRLNARNIFGDTNPIAVGAQPWGEASTVRLAPEKRWYLTNTFSF